MSANRSLSIATILFSLFSGSTYGDQSDSSDDPTKVWGDNLMDSCSALSGAYESIGESIGTPNSNVDRPLLERVVFGIEDLKHEASIVHIEQGNDSAICVLVDDKNGNLLATRQFPPPDYCDGPWAVFESRVKGGGGDLSPHLETNTVSKMARSNDGALLTFVNVTSVSRSWIILKKSSSYDLRYRFEAANNRYNHLTEGSLSSCSDEKAQPPTN